MLAINVSNSVSTAAISSGQGQASPLVSAQALTASAVVPPAASADTQIGDPQREFIRVSSSIGRAASAGQLSRQEAVEIYRQIASML
jgi:hypothetical protein